MKVYLDNAATTCLDKQVLDEMLPYMTDHYGNPSSIHAFGRKAKSAVEKARKIVAAYLQASTSEIFFTGSGTEGSNTVIKCAVRDLGVKRIISSKTEHHCVLHSVEHMATEGTTVSYVKLDRCGRVDLDNLKTLLAGSNAKTLVSLMHSNNEVGTLLNIEQAAEICQEYNAFFHTDAVQTIGYFQFNLQQTKIHFLTGSAHKFHGPKGVGFVYIHHEAPIKQFLEGGSQERNMRAGTENVYGIVGLGKALEIATTQMDEHRTHILSLKKYMVTKLTQEIPDIDFNGDISEGGSNYKVLNVALPPNEKAELTLFNLDIAGIAASGGSACSSGSEKGSHVLEALQADPKRKAVRFSFSKYNTIAEIDYTVDVIKRMLQPATVNG